MLRPLLNTHSDRRKREVWLSQAKIERTFTKVSPQRAHFYYPVRDLTWEIALKLFDILSSPPTEASHNAANAAVLDLLFPRPEASIGEVIPDDRLLRIAHGGGVYPDKPTPTARTTSQDIADDMMTTARSDITAYCCDGCRPPRHSSIASTAAGALLPTETATMQIATKADNQLFGMESAIITTCCVMPDATFEAS